MPPWSSRLLPTPIAPTPPSTSASGTEIQQHSTPIDLDQHSSVLASVHRDAAGTSQPIRNAPAHSRSASHPFPSLFGIGRRTERTHEDSGKQIGHDTSGGIAEPSLLKHLPRSPSYKESFTVAEGEFVTGNCATCDSTVRWPRQLDVYRCTICQMVNDLRPLVRKSLRTDHEPNFQVDLGQESREPPELSRIQRKALALSVERTRILVDQSIELYLLQRSRYRLSQVQSFQQHRYGPQPEESSIATPFLYELNARDTDPASNIDAHRTLDSAIPVRKASPWDEVNLSGIRDSTYDIATVSDGPPTRTPPRPPSDTGTYAQRDPAADSDDSKKIFGRLESYLITCLNDCECLNAAFGSTRPTQPSRATSEASVVAERPKRSHASDIPDQPLFEVDAKTLLLGDIGENGMWWTGDRRISDKKAHRNFVASASSDRRGLRFDWSSIEQWYASIMMCGTTWKSHLQCLSTEELSVLTSEEERYIEARFAEARRHVHRTFVKAVENLLRRPSRPLKSPSDCRFLVILLLNPLLYGHHGHTASSASSSLLAVQTAPLEHNHNCGTSTLPVARPNPFGGATGQHSGIVKRLLGLMANLPAECHRSIVSWLCRLPEPHFKDIVELVGGFVSYRLGKQSGRTWDTNHDPIAGLIPSIAGPGAGTSAYLHAALSTNRRSTQREAKDKPRPVVYANDWQIRVAARVMSLLFTANNSGKHISSDNSRSTGAISSYTVHSAARRRAHRHSQILPTSTFYNTLLDNADLVSDFEKWETRQGKFSFCQYPMFLSIRAKIRIMEHDAHRQMEIKARDAFFTSILSRKAVNQYLVLKVRRDCLVDDSLRNVSEVVGTGQEEIKKGLRIEFVGEEGIDAGGLRKEWFLLLVREVFDPDHGLFVYDDDSRYCYFNPNSFETSDQFFLVGVVLGLAIYNSTILDVALPPFAFRKLLASAPTYTGPTTTAIRPSSLYTIDDLAEWSPVLARGLQQLLDHEGDVETTFCRDFVADVERYGQIYQIPLCSNGEKRPVTNSNRREFVELYIRYLLDTSVARQYEPFKRGFFTVCGGNALSLFRPEEIELLIRGSDEPLDIPSLRAVAVYENWPSGDWIPAGDNSSRVKTEPRVVQWFWEYLNAADTTTQRAILTFITGSDRIPAMGTTSLVIKVVCLTDDHNRYPVARTCFNIIGLHQYRSKDELVSHVWRAIQDSEGFGLK